MKAYSELFLRAARLLGLCLALTALYACGAGHESPSQTEAPILPSSALIEIDTATPVPPTPVPPTPVPPTPTPVIEPFTIAWLPDTQTSVFSQPEAMVAIGAWIHDNVEAENIVEVIHTGDLVNNGHKETEWQVFETAYDQFAGDVPFFCIAGNHDLGVKLQEWDGYLARPYAQLVPDEQQYQDGKSNYTLLSAGGTDFIIIGAGSGAEIESIDWLNEKLVAHRDRVAILLFHEYLHAEYGLREPGKTMLEQVIAVNPNVRLVLCGHFRGTAYREDVFEDGPGGSERVVHTMLCNYQHYTDNTGQIRLLRFDPEDRSITVTTFSALSGRQFRDEHFRSAVFTLENAF